MCTMVILRILFANHGIFSHGIVLFSRPAVLIKSVSYTPTIEQKSEHENFPCIDLNIFHSRKIEKNNPKSLVPFAILVGLIWIGSANQQIEKGSHDLSFSYYPGLTFIRIIIQSIAGVLVYNFGKCFARSNCLMIDLIISNYLYLVEL